MSGLHLFATDVAASHRLGSLPDLDLGRMFGLFVTLGVFQRIKDLRTETAFELPDVAVGHFHVASVFLPGLELKVALNALVLAVVGTHFLIVTMYSEIRTTKI